MSKKSLAELRASAHVGLPRTAYAACLAAPLVLRLREIDIELDTLPPAPDPEAPKPRRRQGQPDPAVEVEKRRTALKDERATVRDQMEDHLVEVILVAKNDYDWREWRLAHPARPDNIEDAEAGLNFDDLLAGLPEHVESVNGDPLSPGDWEWFRSVVAPGHLEEMAWRVVDLHKIAVVVPKP